MFERGFKVDKLVKALRAIAEPTRLRILVLLSHGELTVRELTQVLQQSQPRVSRHIGLLVRAGLVDRIPEGSWVFSRLVRDGALANLLQDILAAVPATDVIVVEDMKCLEQIKEERAQAAANYFQKAASDWDQIRSLHLCEQEVEACLINAIGPGRFSNMLDIGTGSGRMLELLSKRIDHGLGIDQSVAMLGFARSKLQNIENCFVQQADLFDLPLSDNTQDLITIHQVLHYLSDPPAALAEAARVLRPGGTMAVVDFAPHKWEFLRENHAHRRLGFSNSEMRKWLEAAGLRYADVHSLPPLDSLVDEPSLTVRIWIAHGRTS